MPLVDPRVVHDDSLPRKAFIPLLVYFLTTLRSSSRKLMALMTHRP